MHGSFDRPGESENRMQRRLEHRILRFPILLAIALVGLVIAQRAASNWISEAVRAEFAGRFDARNRSDPTGETDHANPCRQSRLRLRRSIGNGDARFSPLTRARS